MLSVLHRYTHEHTPNRDELDSICTFNIYRRKMHLSCHRHCLCFVMFVFSFFLLSQNETTSNWCSSRVQLNWGIFLESITFHCRDSCVDRIFSLLRLRFLLLLLSADCWSSRFSLPSRYLILCVFAFVLVFVCIYYNILHNVYSNEFHMWRYRMWRRWSTVATLYAYFLYFFYYLFQLFSVCTMNFFLSCVFAVLNLFLFFLSLCTPRGVCLLLCDCLR